MPELPEVETIVRDLRPRLVGRRLAGVQVSGHALRRQWSDDWGPRLVGRRVREVGRRGKWILLGLDRQLHLVIHLGMTGQLTVVLRRQPLADHTHVVVDLDRGREQLRFRDVRRFGSATLFAEAEQLDRFFRQTGLGPEPFDLDAGYWSTRLAATSRCLKAVLLDQRVVAGVGNIYADESLYEARLHPARPGKDTSAADAARLRRAVVAVLRRAIDKRGSSIRDYVGGSGARGQFQHEFQVYGRPGHPCPRCRRPIQRIRLGGRCTHFCPQCQRL